MGNRRKSIAIGASCVLVAGLLAWVLFTPRNDEPVYQGKRLSEWLALYDIGTNASRGIKGSSNSERDAAIRAIGTNAIPTLLQLVAATNSVWRDRFAALVRKQNIFHFSFADPSAGATKLNVRASMAFFTLGPMASNAAPGLVRIAISNYSSSSQAYAMSSLSYLGAPGAQLATPECLTAFTSTNLLYGNENPAYVASRILGQNRYSVESGMLLTALTNENPFVRYHACFTVGWYAGLRTTDAIPSLIALLHDTNYFVRVRAAIALGGIRRGQDVAVPAIIEALNDTNSSVRFNAAYALGEFGKLATNAVSALADAYRNETNMPASTARMAGGVVDPKTHQEIMTQLRAVANAIDGAAATKLFPSETEAGSK